MHTRLNSTLITLLICVVISVDANRQHRHQSQHESDSSGSHNSINVKTRSKEENVDLSPNKTPDLMREYMSRQLFQCSADHLGMLAKLNAIIAEAYAQYADCQKQIRNSPKNYEKTSFSALNDLLSEWKEEDADEEAAIDNVEESRN